MSARNYMFSAREKSNKVIDCLPQIYEQKHFQRTSRNLPTHSANSRNYVNRNINCSYTLNNLVSDNLDRVGSPYSDFFSESETGTPDFRSEESDSSAGSALNRSTAEATKTLEDEWERIERTIYDEDGEKSHRPQIVEECEQWKQIHPQLRYNDREHEEVIAMHYSDYEQFSESEERLSQSSTDVTPQNSPRPYIADDFWESPGISRFPRERRCYRDDESDLSDTFCSLLHITPVQMHSPFKKRQNPSILRSDLASSKWMRNRRPDSSINYGRSSAKSFISLDVKNYKTISASDNSKIINGRVLTARQREMAKLEPLYTPEAINELSGYSNEHQSHTRKVSLPPLFVEDDRRKINTSSARKSSKRKIAPKVERLHR
ncbi:uncharacterized protein LOC121727278 isoform X2 [Aricia agestis]|uniref:uncharacterized protein LOC121727278 isoform X2 n=1 Tax=Aricia agestis TaxID=91739 RepID=UPI001C207516|nr:uncharacterized protein LOC121727278 isoform X2 [Aricia agestis]